MGYVNLADTRTRIYVQTGMDNHHPANAEQSAQLLSQILGGVSTGYLNNATEGLAGDVGEYLPKHLTLKDALNEYTYRTLNARGPVLILTHSAGNEDARKALQVGALYGHQYPNLSFLPLASPVSAKAWQQTTQQGGAGLVGPVKDWRDPVTYSKTAGTVMLGSLLGGFGYGAVQGCTSGAAGGGLLGCIALGSVGAAVGSAPGIAGAFAIRTYHPFSSYVAKPQVQDMVRDWMAKHPEAPGKP